MSYQLSLKTIKNISNPLLIILKSNFILICQFMVATFYTNRKKLLICYYYPLQMDVHLSFFITEGQR